MDDGTISHISMKKEDRLFTINKKQLIHPLLLSLPPIMNGLGVIPNCYSIERLIKLRQA